ITPTPTITPTPSPTSTPTPTITPTITPTGTAPEAISIAVSNLLPYDVIDTMEVVYRDADGCQNIEWVEAYLGTANNPTLTHFKAHVSNYGPVGPASRRGEPLVYLASGANSWTNISFNSAYPNIAENNSTRLAGRADRGLGNNGTWVTTWSCIPGSTTDLRVTWAFQLKQSMVGQHEVYASARDQQGRTQANKRLTTVTVLAATPIPPPGDRAWRFSGHTFMGSTPDERTPLADIAFAVRRCRDRSAGTLGAASSAADGSFLINMGESTLAASDTLCVGITGPTGYTFTRHDFPLDSDATLLVIDPGGDTNRADLEIQVPGYGKLCTWSFDHYVCASVIAFDGLDLWFAPAGSSPPPDLATATPTIPATATPTLTPTPTITPTPKATPVAQPTKVLDKVCIYADKFETKSGTTTGTGNLYLGPKGSDGKCSQRNYFVDSVTLLDHTVVQANISWKSTDKNLTVAGVMQLQPHRIPIMADDKLEVNTGDGKIVLSGTVDKYLGKLFPKDFEFPEDFAITFSVLNDYVELSGDINVPNIPENPNFKFTVRGRIHSNGDLELVTDAQTLSFKVAGGDLKAEQLSLTTKGVLRIGKATLTFNGIPPIVVEGLTLGEGGLQFKRIAGGYNFNIPALNLGNFFIIEGTGNKNLQPIKATLHIELLSGVSYIAGQVPAGVEVTALNSQYKIELVGRMRLPKLPGNSHVKVDNLRLTLHKDKKDKVGKLSTSIGRLDLQVAGRPFKMNNLKFDLVTLPIASANRPPGLASPAAGFSYQLIARRTDFKLPTTWGINSTIYLTDVKITDKSPYIQFKEAAAKFKVDKTFWLGGAPKQQVGIAFKVTEGELVLKNTFNKYAVRLTSEVSFILGGQKSTLGNVGGKVKLTIDENGKVTADILGAKLGIAGVQLVVGVLKYEDDAFTAEKATITLPKSWGGGSMMEVKKLRITKDEIKWDNINAEVNIKDVNLKPVLRLQKLKVKLKVNAKSEFEWEIWGTVNILPVNLAAAQQAGTYLTAQEVEGVSADLHVKIARDGKVTGTVTGFELQLIGMKITAKKATFTDEKIVVTEVKGALPPQMGGVTVELFGMTIGGPEGFDVKGGKFNIAKFSFAGVGVENAHGYFKQIKTGHYTFGAGARLNFAQFAVEGGFVMEVINDTYYLRQVKIDYYGTPPAAIGPLGATGLYITHIGGTFDMSEDTLEISVRLGIQTAGKFMGATLLKAEGAVTLRVKPEFRLSTRADLYLIGYKVIKVDATLSPTGFSTRAELNLLIIKIVGYMAFGIDEDQEFTLAAGIQASFVVKKNAIWGWLPFWGDVKIGPVSGEVGKFKRKANKVWGGQGLLNIAGFKVWGFVGFSPLKFEGGGGASPYKVVCPAGHNCGFGNKVALMALAREGGRIDTLMDVKPSRQIALIETVNALNWERAENLVAVQPDGQRLDLTSVMDDRESGEFRRMYIIDRPMVGRWTLQMQAGNTVVVLGTDPEPALTMQVEQMQPGALGAQSVRVVQGSPAHMFGDEGAAATASMQALAVQRPLVLTQEGWLHITWQSSDQSNVDDPEAVSVQLYVEDAPGKRWPITTSNTLNGSYDWQPAIPSGVYTFTVAANDGHNMPVISQVVFDYHDTTPPAAPQGVTSQVGADGVALVSWNATASDPDVAGYRISTSAGETFTVTHPISQAIVTTLDPSASIQADVAAYDMSGNVGPAGSVGMSAPDLQVIAMQPADGSTDDAGAEVTVAFNQPVTMQSFRLLDADGLEVPGETEGLSYDLGAIIPVAEPVWGVRFRPATGWLPAGDYTAEVAVATDVAGGLRVLAAGLSTDIAPAGTTSSYQWTFTISGEPARIWMPLVGR
ncbi:MAG: copper resistance protein CopC, partial [Chloroflexi bacterium]|nr:copper resistance protein CopC [Chloroflexota bacterium]